MRWRPSRSRLWRTAWVSAVALASAYALLIVIVQVRQRLIRSQSEALYADFLKLQSGATTQRDIAALRKRWAGKLPEHDACDDGSCEYTIGNSISELSPGWFRIAHFAHDHMPAAQLIIDAKGHRLLRATYAVRTLVPKGYGTRDERSRIQPSGYVPYSSGAYALFGRSLLAAVLPEACCEPPDPMPLRGYRAFGASSCSNCLAIWSAVLPGVNPTMRKQLLQIDFGCMTRWTVCTDIADLMPGAVAEALRDRETVEQDEEHCQYPVDALAAAAQGAAEVELSGESAPGGRMQARIVRLLGGAHNLRTGQQVTLELSRTADLKAKLEHARAAGGRMVVLYENAPTYADLMPYDACGLLPDKAADAVLRSF